MCTLPHWLRRCFQTSPFTGLALPILFISLLAWLPASAVSATGASMLLTAALAFNAFTSAGVQTYAQTVAPRFAGLLFSIANAFGVLPGVVRLYVLLI